MIEIIIERWSGPDGEQFLWSVWQDGRRLEMGGPHEDPDSSEAAAQEFCAMRLKHKPDRITRL
jgi:hypothetical protein